MLVDAYRTATSRKKERRRLESEVLRSTSKARLLSKRISLLPKAVSHSYVAVSLYATALH